jgi:hypothetical protein
MRTLGKGATAIALLFLAYAVPAPAQIIDGLDFTTGFPFYAGNARMPAGSYQVTQSGIDGNILLIESRDRLHSAFLDFIPTSSSTEHAQSDVTFYKYGDTEYLNRLWVAGQEYGLKVEPTKAEEKMAAATSTVEHSLPATRHQPEHAELEHTN